MRDERARVETPVPVQRSREPGDGAVTGLPVVPAPPAPPSGPTLALPATSNGSGPAALAVQRLGLGDLSSATSGLADTASDAGSAVSDLRDTATSAADSASGLVDTGRGLVDTATDTATAAARGAAGALSDATGGGGAGDDEALARRLYRPILRMLRSELLVDRERRGMRTDRW